MLWSFAKVALFVGLVAAAALGVAWLAESGQVLRVAVAGWEFSLGLGQMVLLGLLVLLAAWILFKALGLGLALLRFVSGDETALSRYFTRNRQRKGYEALADGMLALAAGDGRIALARANKAERYLRRPELTNLVAVQAAEQLGDRRKATEIYKKLLSDERTRFVGVRGLMLQKLNEGDSETALRLAEKAFELKPKSAEVQDILLRLQTESGNWAGARAVLGAKLRSGALPKDVHKRRDAVLALQEAKAIFADGASVEAREAAIAAAKASPDLIPAVGMAARAYLEQDRPRDAARLLRKAWENLPHPDLAAAFAAIAPDEAAPARLARFEQGLLKANPNHEESRLTRTELLIAAEDFPAARRALGDLVETHPTARVLTLRAAIARGEGGDEDEVRGWLARAVSAPRGPQWICDKCQTVSADWGPVCGQCGGFDTLSWREAPDLPPLPNGAEMLPLVVGRPPAPSEAPREAPPGTAGDAARDITMPEPETAPSAPAAQAEKPRAADPDSAGQADDPFAEPPAVAAARGAKF